MTSLPFSSSIGLFCGFLVIPVMWFIFLWTLKELYCLLISVHCFSNHFSFAPFFFSVIILCISLNLIALLFLLVHYFLRTELFLADFLCYVIDGFPFCVWIFSFLHLRHLYQTCSIFILPVFLTTIIPTSCLWFGWYSLDFEINVHCLVIRGTSAVSVSTQFNLAIFTKKVCNVWLV